MWSGWKTEENIHLTEYRHPPGHRLLDALLAALATIASFVVMILERSLQGPGRDRKLFVYVGRSELPSVLG